jgi:hypothetical protein
MQIYSYHLFNYHKSRTVYIYIVILYYINIPNHIQITEIDSNDPNLKKKLSAESPTWISSARSESDPFGLEAMAAELRRRIQRRGATAAGRCGGSVRLVYLTFFFLKDVGKDMGH